MPHVCVRTARSGSSIVCSAIKIAKSTEPLNDKSMSLSRTWRITTFFRKWSNGPNSVSIDGGRSGDASAGDTARPREWPDGYAEGPLTNTATTGRGRCAVLPACQHGMQHFCEAGTMPAKPRRALGDITNSRQPSGKDLQKSAPLKPTVVVEKRSAVKELSSKKVRFQLPCARGCHPVL